MTKTLHRRSASRPIVRFLMLLVIAPLLVTAASAQTTSVTDGKTPTGLTPGAPSGSYALSGFDNVNLFNGNLNFHLPLLNIGGRGGAGYTMTLPIEQKWIVKKGQPDPYGITPLTPNPNWWQGIKPGYRPGVLQGRRTGYGLYPYGNYCGSVPNVSDQTLTRLTFTAADGTEYELRDQLTNGAPGYVSSVPCNEPGTSRGKVFITADGSSATFISDTTIYDYKWLDIGLNNRLFYPSGYLMLKDGTRNRIDSGYVSWIRDRNGNKLTSFGGTTTGGTITDSLNRKVTVTLNNGVGYDEISYSGFAGIAGGVRKIRVWYDSLSNRLRPNSGYSIQTYYGLFPNLNSASTYSTYNPSRVSKVELPDGRLYEFYYNPYGELARVVLPTGGAFEYDWGGGAYRDDELIFRYVTERRVYLVAGGTAEHKTQYIQGGSGAGMEVKTLNAAGTTLLARSLHYFYGDPYLSMVEDPGRPSAISFSPWKEGHEYRTETFDIVNGTAVLKQKVEHSWQQPVAGSTWPLTQAETSVDSKANDPLITQTVTTLSDTNQVAKQTFSYDRYSNRTDAYEYDYGSGTAGSLVRRSHTDYLTTNPVNGYDYACNPATTCGNSANIFNVIHIRSLATQQQVFDGGGIERSRATIEYDNYVGANHGALWPRPSISGLCAYYDAVGNCYSSDDPAHPPASYATRGNVTATTSYILSVPTTTISAYAQYDIAGNVIKMIDGRGYATNIYYSDCFGGPDGNARLNSQPLELSSVSQFSYALPTSVTNTLNQTTYSQFDYYTGQTVDGEDLNGIVASGFYNDLLDRPTQIRRAVGTSLVNQTTFSYNDANRTVTTTSDQNSFNDPNPLKSQALYDGLGRTVEGRQYESATAFITTKTTYDALGRASQVSNPYRAGETVLWTTTAYDALSRVLSVTTPDSAVIATSYSGNTVTVSDQAGKQRKSVTDALGRLAQVCEAADCVNYLTSYTYDVLGNLRKVDQGSQQRFFMYDSLSRLIRAKNPEQAVGSVVSNMTDPITGNTQWSMAYGYDNNSNLTARVDARDVTTTYTYDALNRNTLVDYSDATPDSYRQYDLATNGKGRINQIWQAGTTTSATYIDQYDPFGRPLIQRQRYETAGVWSASYQTSQTYDLAGHVKTISYPSGHIVTYNYDAAGRLGDKDAQNLAFSGNLGAGGAPVTYAAGILYSPFGGMSKERFGTDTALYNKQFYNVRGQLAEIRVGTYSTDEGWWNRGAILNVYSALAGWTESREDNNGNLRKQMVYIPNNDQISGYVDSAFFYDYDSLNRLDVAREVVGGQNSWVQDYDYDRYGNRTINPTNTWGTGVNNKQFTVNTANNRLGVPAGQSGELIYDNVGSLTRDTYSGVGYTRAYDAENRMSSETQVNAYVGGTYVYNADGQRVRRKVNGVETWQLYGIGGELVAEYAVNASAASPQREYGYRSGQLLITAEPTATSDTVWVEDSVPAGAATAGDGEGWNWVSSSPPPASGTVAHQSNVVGGVHQHYFYNASSTLTVGTGDKLFAYVYLDPANLPSEVMLQFNDGSWEHRAYWGANNPGWGIDGTNSRRYQGPLPSAGGWVRLEVAASAVGLEGHTLNGMAFSLWNGRATWDRAGKSVSTGSANISWLVADQLGTPRMVFDKTGSLAGTKRHDYLPFGEELYAGQGVRTIARGYGANDGVRQKFTSKERDIETGLDYFGARYFASMQGRFTSVDPSGKSIMATNPQTWNRYNYTLNNPLRYVDENGKWPTATHNRVIETAFRTLDPKLVRHIQRGSESVDRLGGSPRTLYEKNAPQHAMTPGYMVRQLGSEEKAREWAKGEATKFINGNMSQAKDLYEKSSQANEAGKLILTVGAFESFGKGAHTIMDGASPAHRDFQVYDTQGYKLLGLINPALGVVAFGVDMNDHANSEERQPTTQEMNQMVDDLRMQFLNAFGREAYERAVPEEDRKQTEERKRKQRQ